MKATLSAAGANLPPKTEVRVAEASSRAGTFTALGLAVWSLTLRELVRFFRQRSRLVGALAQPVLFWILFGAGLQGSFRGPTGESFQEYFFAGVAVMIVLFTAIFSTISLIEDRREGFLQAVLVAPVPRLAIVLGKVCGGTILATLQAALFLMIGPLLGTIGLAPPLSVGIGVTNVIPVLGWLVLLGFTLTAVGYVIAWPMQSTQGFHAIMSVVLMPMWLLSGAFFPVAEVTWLKWVMLLNPLTYGVAGLRQVMGSPASGVPESVFAGPSGLVCLTVTSLFGSVCLAGAVWLTNRRSVRNTR